MWPFKTAPLAPNVITLKELRALHACPEQVDQFRRLFGKSVAVTEALAAQHVADFSLTWAADHFLTIEGATRAGGT